METKLPRKLTKQSKEILLNFKGRLTRCQLTLDTFITNVLGYVDVKYNQATFQHLVIKALNN